MKLFDVFCRLGVESINGCSAQDFLIQYMTFAERRDGQQVFFASRTHGLQLHTRSKGVAIRSTAAIFELF